jgi:Sec-independent protein translocase protein TatA
VSGGQILCLSVVALLVFGSVMASWANAWAKRGRDSSNDDTGEIPPYRDQEQL